MSHRKDEKERLRAEREEAERAAAAAGARQKRLGIVAATVLVLAAVIAVAVALAAGGSDDGGGKSGSSDIADVKLPPTQERGLAAAAKAADCQLLNPTDEGADHTTNPMTYKANPPTSGDHNPEPAADGIYAPGTEPAEEHTVHTLEHGRIEFQYKPGTPKQRIGQLQTLAKEEGGYHALLFQNQTKMPYDVAATAWDHSIVCKAWNDKVFDALRAFRVRWTDQAPEQVP
jgi:Protein of unknown function (DUF3105)